MTQLTETTLLNKLAENNYNGEIVINLNLETIKMRAAAEGRVKVEYLPSRHTQTIKPNQAVKIYNKYAN